MNDPRNARRNDADAEIEEPDAPEGSAPPPTSGGPRKNTSPAAPSSGDAMNARSEPREEDEG